MKNPLNKRLIRDFKHNIGKYLALSTLLIASIGFLTGFLATADGIKSSFDKNRVECKLEDGLFTSYFEVNEDVISKINDLGTKVYKNYYVNEKILNEAKLRIYENREEINIATVMEGRLPEGKYEIAVDRLFAENNSIKVNDKIKINNEEYMVTGKISLPDYSSLFEDNANLMMETKYFGVAIISKEAFNNLDKENLVYNYSYYNNNRNLNEEEIKNMTDDIKEILLENNVQLSNFITSDKNQSISFVEDDMGSDVPMIKVFCYIIIAIMAFVFAILVLSTIEAEAPIIGTLLSNGYSKLEILNHYVKMPIFIAILSAIIGNIIGYTLFPNVFKEMYYNSYSLPPCRITVNLEALVLTTILPILIMVLINVIVIALKLNKSPLRFLRKDLKRHSNKKPVKLPNFKFINRFRLRVILQNKGNYLMLLIGIFLGGVILMFGFSMKPLINNFVDTIKDTNVSEYQYILKMPIETDNKQAEKFTINSMKIYNEELDKDFEISLYGIEENSNYFNNLNIDNSKEGVYLSDSLIEKLKLKVGDNIEIKDSNNSNKKYTLKILGSYYYRSGFAGFMTNKSLNKLLGYDEDYFNGYFSDDKLEIKTEMIAKTITTEDMVKLGEQMTTSFGEIAGMCIVIAVLIYVILIYLLTKVVIDKNAINISFMKVFGYDNKEINKLYLQATSIVVLISLLITLPFIKLTLNVCFEEALKKVNGYLEVIVYPYTYILIVIIGLLSYLVINLLQMRHVNSIKMSEALKNRE
ncbi:MAG: ABC transporter permease [Clostridiales bacterium]|nr:ABC transporter permease [Clostridiales bacterium]